MTQSQTKTLEFGIKAVNEAQRTFTGEASNMAEDAMGDVIPPSALDLSRFRTNPCLLRDHDHHAAIGTVVRDWKTADGWWIEAQVFSPGVSAAADQAWSEIAAGGRKGLSIGFQGVEWEPRVTSTGGQGVKWTKIKVLEVSSVNLPACPSCLLTAHKGMGCACDGAEAVVELDDEDVGVTPADVLAAVKALVPELAAAAAAVVARARGQGAGDDEIELSREAVREAFRVAIPQLLKQEFLRLRGKVD